MEQKKPERRRIGAILIDDGLLTLEQLNLALEAQKATGKPLGETLIAQGYIDDKQLASALGRQLKIPYIPLLKYSHNPEAAKWVGRDFCVKYTLVPFDGDEKTFYVSMANPLDRNPIDSLQTFLKKRICTFIGTPDEIRKTIDMLYSEG